MKLNRLKIFILTFSLLITDISLSKLTVYAESNIYFEKKTDLEDDTSIDDIILTVEERKLSCSSDLKDFNEELVENLIEDKSKAGIKTIAIDALNVERYFYPTFLSKNITHEVEKHTYTRLYDSVNNDIYWKNLFNIVKENNKKYQKEIKEKHKSSSIEIIGYEPFTDEELKLMLKYIQKFVAKMKADKPDLDMKNLACKLNDLVLGYELDYENTSALASSLYSTILFPLVDGCYPKLEEMEETLDHEVKHLINNPCVDEIHEDFSIDSTGVNIEANDIFEYSPFNWRFIEEAYAEKDSTTEPQAYPRDRYLVETLEMVNGFVENDIDLISEYGIEHNPIGVLQQFLVLGNNNFQNQQWILQNAIMLECYNAISSSKKNSIYIYSLERKYGFEISYDTENIRNSSFSNYSWNQINRYLLEEANLHLLRLGLSGIALNLENSGRNLTKKDCLYLVKLLNYRIEQHSLKIQELLEISSINSEYYIAEKERLLERFESYLLEQSILSDELDITINDVNLDTYILSDAFSEKECEYYRSLFKELSIEPMEIKKMYKNPGER